jgi:hypothetical protein
VLLLAERPHYSGQMDRGSKSDHERLRDLEERVAALERQLGAAEARVEDDPDEGDPDGATPPRQLPDAVEGTTTAVPAPGDAAPPAEGY